MTTKVYGGGETFERFPEVPDELPLELVHDWLRDADRHVEADRVKAELFRLGRGRLFTSVKAEFCRAFCGACPGCMAAWEKVQEEDRVWGCAAAHDHARGRPAVARWTGWFRADAR